jgi:aspartate/methionine/tyrosine aminotransferase
VGDGPKFKKMLTLDAIRPAISRIPVEDIFSFASGHEIPENLIALWYGEGDLPTPEFIGDAAADALRAGKTFYPPQNGVPQLRQALSKYLTGLHGRPVEHQEITITVGAMDAILMALLTIVEAGDNVIVIDPVWPNIKGIAAAAGAEVRSVPMELTQDGWFLDLAKVEAEIDGKTRLLNLASPGNPTGAVVDRETQVRLLEMARRYGFWILSDEVYNRLYFEGDAAPSFLDIRQPGDRVMVANSFSKSWAMTGWRVGWLVHPPELEQTMAMLVQYSTSGVATFLQYGALAAVRDGEALVGQIRERCRTGRDLIYEALGSSSRAILPPKPAGAMYVYFAVDGMPDSREAARSILGETGVGLTPGIFFSAQSEGFLRLCTCRDEATLKEAAARLAGNLV